MPDAKPLITLALQIEIPPGKVVWNLHTASGDLVGWTPVLPNERIAYPGAYQYHTGAHVIVAFDPDAQIVPLG